MTTWLVYWESPAYVGVLVILQLSFPILTSQRICRTRESARKESVLDKRVCKTRECARQESVQDKRVCKTRECARLDSVQDKRVC